MSRVGKQPVAIPSGVKVNVNGQTVSVEGSLGKLEREFRSEVTIAIDDESKTVVVTRDADDRLSRALHGLTRALIQNMVEGVSKGYEKRLEVVGVGYVAGVQNNEVQLRVGYANEIKKPIPQGLDVTCPDNNHIVVKGCDKQMVGQFAAEIRAARKPEPYKGKGVRYEGEFVKIKPGKAATSWTLLVAEIVDRNKFNLKVKTRRKRRVRKPLRGTPERPRLSIYRSHKQIYCQAIDDTTGKTLASASTRDKGLKGDVKYGGNSGAASIIGKALAERLLAEGVNEVCFDRGAYKYHGRVAALADAAREAGLKF